MALEDSDKWSTIKEAYKLLNILKSRSAKDNHQQMGEVEMPNITCNNKFFIMQEVILETCASVTWPEITARNVIPL